MKLNVMCLSISVFIGLIAISECEIRLNFRINLQPFSFSLPKFKLPPIKISAHFIPPTNDDEPPTRMIGFPGITFTGQNSYKNNLDSHRFNQATSYHEHQSSSINSNDEIIHNQNPHTDYHSQDDFDTY